MIFDTIIFLKDKRKGKKKSQKVQRNKLATKPMRLYHDQGGISS